MLHKKQLAAAGLVFCLGASVFTPASVLAETPLAGEGSSGNPYQITSAEDLIQFSSIVNGGDYDAYATLMNDITLDAGFTPIGGRDSGSAFTGVFDGSGHTITLNLGASSDSFEGLFSYNSGTIENVTTAGSVTGTEYAAGIAAVNRGTIKDCKNTAAVTVTGDTAFGGGISAVSYGTISGSSNEGSISAQSSGSCIGGITGTSPDGQITRTANSGAVSLSPSASDTDYKEGSAGGISGLNYNAAISISSNTGQISNTDDSGYTGGITGLNNGTIDNCFNQASISGNYYAGGIAGYLFLNEDAGNATIHNTLNTGTVSENQTGYGAVCGTNTNGTIYDNYYKEGTAPAGTGSSDNNGATVQTEDMIKSGATAYLLNGRQSADCIWYQDLSGSGSGYPSFNSEDGTIYRDTDDDNNEIFTNDSSQHKDHQFQEDGSCSICGYKSVELKGHSLTLDGAIGINYYFYIDPMYYSDDSYRIETSFTVSGRTETDPFDKSCVIATDNDGTAQAYGFQLYEKSDEMTKPITAVLNIYQGDEEVVSLKAEEFRSYDYLKTIYENEEGKFSDDLKNLAQSLATYDYYANEYFQYSASYTPEINRLALGSITQDTLAPYRQTTEDQDSYGVKHYGSSLQLLESTKMSFMASVDTASETSVDTDNLYMGYKTSGSGEDYHYVKAEKFSSYYRAFTEKVPSSDLNVLWDVAFFEKTDSGSYKQVSAIKKAGPFSYAENALRTSKNEKLHHLVQALYLYYENSASYFHAESQE